jgi:hypothetical protein
MCQKTQKQELTIDDYIAILGNRWTNKDFKRKLIIVDEGPGWISVKLEEKDYHSLLEQVRKEKSK